MKLAVLALLAAVMIGSIVRGVPDLSTGSGATASLLLGLGALAWMVVRTAREGGFVRAGGGVLAGVPRAERRVLRRARRCPEQVPEHLAALAARYARQQADGNDRFGWLMIALVLFQAPTRSNHLLGSSPVAAVAYVVFIVALGVAGDRLGQLGHRAERTQQQHCRKWLGACLLVVAETGDEADVHRWLVARASGLSSSRHRSLQSGAAPRG